jgi:demethylsterigmatocystin 6-O-methyltransferase
MVRIGLDLNIFNILSESSEPLTVTQLAVKTGAAATLTGKVQKSVSDI